MDRDLAIRAVSSLQAGASPSSEEYAALRAEVGSYMHGAWPSLSVHDLEESTDAAIERFIGAVSRVSELEPDRALGYLLRTARNGQIDRFRSRRTLPVGASDDLASRPVADDEILSWLDHDANLRTIRSVLTKLADDGDQVAIQVVVVWLDLAEASGAAPSSRHVADALNVAHTTVSRALRRFREAVEEVNVA